MLSAWVTCLIFQVQIWRPGNLNASFDILVGPESKDAFLGELDDRWIIFDIKIEDLQE